MGRSTVCMILYGLSIASFGCNQNPAGTPPLGAASTAGVNQQAYVAELQRRADEQARIAAQQRSYLADLKQQQQSNEQALATLRAQQKKGWGNGVVPQAQLNQELTDRARAVLGRYEEIDRRVRELDRNNAELHARLAQVRQRNELLSDQNHLLQRQLDETSQQLSASIDATKDNEKQLQTMLASSRRRSGASITANNSYRRNLTAVMVPGLSIRQDGELVRIELPSDSLFEERTARLTLDSAQLMDQVAEVILKNYPRQIVGIEVHCDNRPLTGTLWRNQHQLTAAQSMAVFEQLSNRHQLLPQQMFVMGHGQNYPLASNATDAGQSRNRRVEIVIYPQQVGQRGE